MNQLHFDFADHSYPDVEKFLGHANAELLHVLQNHQEQFLFVWGEPGVGKSHILQAWVGQTKQQHARVEYIDVANSIMDDELFEMDAVAIDQVELLGSEEQQKLFALFNHFHNRAHGQLLLSATCPPAQLALRDDLRSRLAYCLVYEIKPLSDNEKIDVLMSMARSRQIPVDEEVFSYLLRYWRRDLDSLIMMLNTLNNYALAKDRRVTLPLLRTLLKNRNTHEFGDF